MSFYVEGVVVGTFKKDDFVNEVNEVTGEAIDTVIGAHFVQIMVNQTMEDGSSKAELLDFKTEDHELYKTLIGKRNLFAVTVKPWNINGRFGLSYKMLDSANKAKFNKTESAQKTS
ncbi:hypothetical protein [Wohlfahrtiimonas larvae]|uniref:Uncharacterized protein n=1 Tax=Wohlfahrtiimonas larvae TaxID=1157986 RepID=A0ABP9MLF5_9GAMM|nr:hypothetical protein [Wohlfahrtiimonas larvae]